jgi:ferredoxin
MAPVADFLNGDASHVSEKVPFVLLVDRESVLHKAIVADKVVRAARQCTAMWHLLQELGGIHNSHAARLLEREQKLWAEKSAKAVEPAGEARPAPENAQPAAAEALPTAPDATELQRSSDDASIETERCSSCNECILINNKMFAYNANKQAYIADLNAGTYRQLVEAAESCQVSVIHPGKPRNPDEPDVEELLKRAEPFH